jgi:hypothetical protein
MPHERERDYIHTYWGDAGFQSQLGHRLSWLRLYYGFPESTVPASTSIRLLMFLPDPFQFIIHKRSYLSASYSRGIAPQSRQQRSQASLSVITGSSLAWAIYSPDQGWLSRYSDGLNGLFSILGSSKRFFVPLCPNWFYGPHNLLPNGYQEVEAWSWPLTF